METNKNTDSSVWEKFYQINYWRLGFQTRLYDLLTPQAYRESAHRCVQSIPVKKGQVLLDAGCGSGLLIEYLRDQLAFGLRYLGTDIQFPGVQRALGKVPTGDGVQCLFFNGDLTQPLPVKKESIDIVVAHFSLYTVADPESRKKIIFNLMETLRPRGLMVIVDPSKEYDGKRILRESVAALQEERGILAAWAKRLFVYPFTYYLGLKFIERQLKTGAWRSFSLDEMCKEMEQLGMTVVHTEPLYAGSAHLVTARRPSAS
ncbi:MAG: hypothetical protein NPINA01_31250 [Nitrospinaceae bacterium]|nr:MAG: hypothetical protein NPINA01_31250 [Nitrospinaceae bacterium]